MQKALVTSTELSAREASFETNSEAERSVIASSSEVNHPEVSGQVVTSFWESGGSISAGTTHSLGIEARSAALFRAPICSQVSPFSAMLALVAADLVSCWVIMAYEFVLDPALSYKSLGDFRWKWQGTDGTDDDE